RGRSASTRCTTSSTTCTTSAPRSESVDPPVARGSTTAAWGDLLRADGAATAPARFLHSGDVRQLLGGRGAAACAARRPGRARGHRAGGGGRRRARGRARAAGVARRPAGRDAGARAGSRGGRGGGGPPLHRQIGR